ncbi:UNVERIFIED_CONTAM: hypothetical protein HDU68_001309 [Siphonaria sp. JEL0065]|nr:hypothetical protein HDU68_001309 [Siphonaria sp. JEL0065]
MNNNFKPISPLSAIDDVSKSTRISIHVEAASEDDVGVPQPGPSAPPQSRLTLARQELDTKVNVRKSAKEEFQNQAFVLWFLLPAFDNKGRPLDLEQFDRSDFDDATFELCGMHPRSCFISYWNFFMTCEV